MSDVLALPDPLAIPESQWLARPHAARAAAATDAMLGALTGLAAHCRARGETQEAADVLAWVLAQTLVPPTTQALAQALWDEMATWVCPRVLWDARAFAASATLADVCEYAALPTG